ncbi:MAG: hypothetical protein LiPW39_597 [Parcubacteria group bacterium LiPW_39]|nr:MAG: hypothetical protein LiPW39_597 [Parcubacteria group bacterium LiPW_39]
MRLNRRKKIRYPVFATFEKEKLPKRARRKISWKIWLWGGIFILVLGGLVYLTAISPVFKIKEIAVSGNNFVSAAEIEEAVRALGRQKFLKIITQDTIFALSGKKIENKILTEFPALREIKVKKIPFDKIEILVKEREPAAVWCQTKPESVLAPTPVVSATSSAATQKKQLPQSEQCYFVDKEGILFRQAPEISGTLAATFYDSSGQAPVLGNQVVASSTIAFAQQLKKAAREIGLDITAFLCEEQISQDLSVLTSEGWWIYFDVSRPALTQMKIVESLLGEEIKEKRVNLQYVDLRITNRVYYR